MIKITLLVFVSLFFAACNLSEPTPTKANEKAFAEEDAYILFALRAEQVKDHKSAAILFETLYEKSDKKEYLYRSLENDLVAKNYDKLITRVDKLSLEEEYDAHLVRLKVVSLFELNRLDSAILLSVTLAATTKEPRDYLLTSDIYVKRQEFDLAVRYLESAYAKEHNEQILDKMSIVLYVNLGKKKEAIAHLETHSRMLGCSRVICMRLAAFYSNDNNIEGLLSTYLRLYNVSKDEEVADKIIKIYTYKRDYLNLMDFLESSRSDDEALLQLYSSSKNYAKAFPLADELYAKTSELDYLGQSAIFEYENAKDRNDKKLLESVVSKLERVSSQTKELIYLNYLGYILIDHELDVKRGMTYIDEVLKQQPDSAFYLDSKAWGYYKLGQCKKADKLMKRVVKLEGGDDPEVLSHVKAIKKCLKKKKGKK